MLHPIPAAPGHTPKLPCPYTRVRRALSGATRSPRRSVEQRPTQSELKKVRKCLFRSVVRQHRKAVACVTHAPWLVWCTRSLPKRSLCRIPSWTTLGIGGSPDEARCREGTYKTPVTTTLSRSFYCSALLSPACSWSSYSLHIPLAPSHRRTFTGPLREDKPRSAPGVAEQCQAKKRKKNPPPKSTATHHRNEASISSGSTHPGPLPYGLGRLRQRYGPLTPPSLLASSFCGWLTGSCCCCCCRPKQV
jgi:hypothetical protein